MRSFVLALAVSVLFVGPGCGSTDSGPTGEPSATGGKADNPAPPAAAKYADLDEWLNEHDGAGYDRWRAVIDNLKSDFDRVCGDTFCGGDYPPWTITLTCSAAIADGKISHCAWLFAGAYATVSPTGGTISHHKKFWTCPLPWSGLTPKMLLDTLAPPPAGQFGNPALQRPLPSGKSTYDALGDCNLGH